MNPPISQYEPALTWDILRFERESHHYDRKSARLAPKELARHMSAFANADGGVIALGIEDAGEVTGLETRDGAENEFRQAPTTYLEYVPEYNIELLPYLHDSKGYLTVMLVHVKPSLNRVIKMKDGKIYLRIGDHSNQLTVDEAIRLEYARGVRSFEEQIVEDATFDDLDPETLTLYGEKMNTEVSTIRDLLCARGAIRVKDGVERITCAGILLFGKMPTQFIPCARVRFLRYDGTHEGVGGMINIVKDEVVELPLPRLLLRMKDILASQMREFQTLDEDGTFKKHPEYPEFAWLEGLVNAVTHRDYSISGEYIRIKMFDDRIEFLSPGKLPNIVTVENIRTTRYSRNPVIARVLSDFGWVKELNEGVKRIYIDMENFFLEPPVYSEPGNNVQLVLKNNIAMRSMHRVEEIINRITAERWRSFDALERKIVILVSNYDRCTMRDLIDYTEKSRVTIQKRLKKLIPDVIVEHKTSENDPQKFYTLK